MSTHEVELVNMRLSCESRAGVYVIKIEKGDLRQHGTVYPSMVRRVTITDGNGQSVIEVFRGFDCTKKASKWLKHATKDVWKPNGSEWMWL
jgi:hypothetical protein